MQDPDQPPSETALPPLALLRPEAWRRLQAHDREAGDYAQQPPCPKDDSKG